MGRLHTRYAPVRRSPPVYCYTALPRDLHVLGLPLAFILSQDQTLRCIEDLLMLFLFSRPGLICAIFPKKIYPETSVSAYACFPVLFLLGTIASKNARTSVRLYLSPPASAGGVYYLFSLSLHPRPFGSGAQR